MHITIRHSSERERVFTFPDRDVIRIGRSPDNDIVLRGDAISARHLKVTVDRARDEVRVEVRVEVRGEGQVEEQVVGPDDEIELGSFRLSARANVLPKANDPVEQNFLAVLLATPRDDVTRAVYADWLEEKGRYAQAKFLRAQLVVREVDGPTDKRFVKASSELVALTKKVSAAWRARVAMTFVESATCTKSKVRWPHDSVGFDLECPKRWDEMKPTAFDGARTCDVCHEVVTYCSTIEEARALAMQGKCIALDIGVRREAGDLIDPTSLIRGRPAPPLISLGAAAGRVEGNDDSG